MEDSDTNSLLSVDVIQGASDYVKAETRELQRTGSIGEPFTEYILFGWTIMSLGEETNQDNVFSAQTGPK